MNGIDMLVGCAEIEMHMKEMEKIDEAIDAFQIEDFSLPADFDPDPGSEEEADISRNCEALENEMKSRGFAVDLNGRTPLRVRYLYVQHVALVTEGLKMPGKWQSVFNGCTGWCEECFQGAWCSVREENEKEADDEPIGQYEEKHELS